MRRWLWRLRGMFYLAPGALILAVVCLFVFLIQRQTGNVDFAYGYTFRNALEACFSLNFPLLIRGFFWQPLTYIFLHGNWFHLGMNMLTVLLFGSALEAEIGMKRFWRVFLIGGVLGGLGWLAITLVTPHLPALPDWTGWLPEWARAYVGDGRDTTDPMALSCMGASGGVFALIGAYAALFPQRNAVILLFWVIPIRLKVRTLAWLLGILTILEIVLVQAQVAYSAHVVGGLVGYLYAVRLRRSLRRGI